MVLFHIISLLMEVQRLMGHAGIPHNGTAWIQCTAMPHAALINPAPRIQGAGCVLIKFWPTHISMDWS